MRSRKFKGFTLIECLVAMAILGVASMLLVQAYTQLMRVTVMNDTINYSISQQMANAEKPGDSGESNTAYKVRGDEDLKLTATIPNAPSENQYKRTYTCKVDVYCVKPYANTNGSAGQHRNYASESGSESISNDLGEDIRYIYFHKK